MMNFYIVVEIQVSLRVKWILYIYINICFQSVEDQVLVGIVSIQTIRTIVKRQWESIR